MAPPAAAERDRQARRLLVVGALLTAVGIAVAATAPISGTAPAGGIHGQQTAGGLVLLAGWGILAWGIHRFGRGG